MPAEKKSNESQFYFMCGSLDPSTFFVLDFEGSDAVSALYEFTLSLEASKNDINPADIISKPATLFMFREGKYYPYSGLVSRFRFVGCKLGKSRYEAVLAPKLSVLDLQLQTRIFQKKSVPDVIKEVLDTTGLQGYYKLELSQTYPVQEFVVQYQETDFSFISRLMESAGMWYFFREPAVGQGQLKPGGSQESLAITDKPASFQSIEGTSTLPFRTAGGMVERDEAKALESVVDMSLSQSAIPKDVLLKNYNYRTPEVDLTGKSTVKNGNAGAVYEFGGSFKNVSEAQRAAEVEANRLATQQTLVSGSGNARPFRAGYRFTLSEHERKDLNADYVILSVNHRGGHETEIPTYNNSFTALPAANVKTYAPQRKTPLPKINGVMTAMIETSGSNYASLDDQGRYKVRMQFDHSSAKNSEASKYMRLSQPYAGPKYGMHFPSHEGAEMVFACIDGDPNRPVGLGTVPNADTLSPVVSANKQQNILRTAGGSELLMDDTDQKQKVHLLTKAKNIMEMDDGEKKLYLQTTKLNQVLLDDKNERVAVTAKQHTIVMDYKSGQEGVIITTAGGHVIKVDDKNKSITVQSTAGSAIQIDDNKKSIVMKDCNGKNTVTLDGNKGLSLDSQGKIEITATQDIEIKGANIKVTAQNAIEAAATADLKLKGMNVEANADMNAKVNAGMNLDLKGGMQTTVDGMMTNLNGSTMTKVKGAIVMIN